ncbi:hypothetical protein Pan181_50230 [Aeoliella mucimassa]|uniref:Uncharacterized protein n=1 Tax=Aeoliella mucimassa TaxID=2527972 RepID=A0A518AVP4_9BACT|nr:hypothetical protein Pan181_50230 [Aeoliella mucimassa]
MLNIGNRNRGARVLPPFETGWGETPCRGKMAMAVSRGMAIVYDDGSVCKTRNKSPHESISRFWGQNDGAINQATSHSLGTLQRDGRCGPVGDTRLHSTRAST